MEKSENEVVGIKVRGYHLDLYGHVNNARYLEFLEEARWFHYEKLFENNFFENEGLAFVIVNVNINYRKPAVLGNLLEIETEPKSFTSRKVTLSQKITLDSGRTVIADAEVTFVLVDAKTGRAVRLTDEMKKLLGKL